MSRSALAIGLERAGWMSRQVGSEIRTTRLMRGWSQRDLAERVGLSQATVSRFEAGWHEATVAALSQVSATLSLELSVRVFPAKNVVLRDERQLRLVEMIVSAAHTGWSPLVEARVSSDPPDMRAADLLLRSAVEVGDFEIERDLSDWQAQVRADLLKRDAIAERETRPVRFILAVPDTRRLRALVREHASFIRATLPAPSRHIWACIRSGKPIGADGLLWLPPAPVPRARR